MARTADTFPADTAPNDSPYARAARVRPAAGSAGAVPEAGLRVLLPLVAFVVLVCLFYMASVHGYGGTSDKATLVLEGQAIAGGNVLLHGWSLPLDSFWTSDALLLALMVPLAGVHAWLMHLESATVSSLLVCCGVFVAFEGGASRRAAIAGGATAGALLVIPAPMLENFMLAGAYHMGTAIWTLLAFIALRRGRFGPGWIAAVVCLALGALADLDLVAFGMVPMVLAGLVAMARRRDWRSGLPQLSAGLASVALFAALRQVAMWLGGFAETGAGQLVNLRQLRANLSNLLVAGADLLGASGRYGGFAIPGWVQLLHLLGAAAVMAGVVVAAASLVLGAARGRPVALQGEPPSAAPRTPAPWVLDDLLAIAIVGAAGTFLFQAVNGVEESRYMSVSVIFACVLCGRMVARVWTAIDARTRRAVTAMAMLIVGGLAAGLGYQLSTPATPPTATVLASWLEAHHLYDGIGDYWCASITTVESGGRVTVRPVASQRGLIFRMTPQSAADWYDRPFQFLVFTTPVWLSVDGRTAARTFGTPAHSYTVGAYQVLVWDHPIVVPRS